MIRTLKKITGALLLLQILLLGISSTALAADGVITFTDLSTQVGEIFTVNCKIDGKGTALTHARLEMSYDPTYVQFISGDGIDASVPGKLIYDGSGSGDVLRFSMELQALQEGHMRMNLDQATVTTASGGQMQQVELGYSDIQIGAGDPSKIVEQTTPTTGQVSEGITVNGIPYSLSEDFTDMELPMGFVRTTITHNGASYQGAVQENASMQLAYLVNEAQEKNFFIYNESDNTFAYFEQIILSMEAESYIVLLQKGEETNVPKGFEEVNLTMNSHEFKAWQEMKNLDFYLIYAQNQLGERGFYRYDLIERTYQRYAMEGSEALEEEVSEVGEEEQTNEGLLGNLLNYMADHVEQVFIAIILLTILFAVLLIILGVKLYNRNLELDEFYDEYEVDVEEEEVEPSIKKDTAKKNTAKKKPVVKDYDDLDFDFDLEEKHEIPKKKTKKKPPVNRKPEAQRSRPAAPKRGGTKKTGIEFIDLD